MLFLERGTAVLAYKKLFLIIGLIISFPSFAMAEELLIFVSFSMPDASLTQWAEQAKKVNAPILLQGLKNNSLKETINHLNKSANPRLNNFLINPELFQKFHIDKVPAVVITDGNSFDVVYGDQSLSSALQKLRQGNFGYFSRRNLLQLDGLPHE